MTEANQSQLDNAFTIKKLFPGALAWQKLELVVCIFAMHSHDITKY